MDIYPSDQPPGSRYVQQMIRVIIGFMAGCLMLALYQPATAHAAEPAVSISPSIYQMDLSRSGVTPNYVITVRNTSDKPVKLTAGSLDITGQTAEGTTIFAPAGTDTDHDIGNSLRYEPEQFELAPNGAQKVTVSIQDPGLLEPGGHYGAVTFTAASSDGSSPVGLRQAVASLLFVTTSSGGVKTIGEPAYTVPRFSWRLPRSTDVVIPNTGNTQIAPAGSFQIKRHDKLVAIGAVNADSNLVLPGQNRLFKTPLRYFGGLQLAGRYHIELRLTATPEASEQFRTSTLIYVSPWFVVIVSIALTIVIFTGIRLRKRRLHKRLQN